MIILSSSLSVLSSLLSQYISNIVVIWIIITLKYIKGSQNALAVSCTQTVDPRRHALWIAKGINMPLYWFPHVEIFFLGFKRPMDATAIRFVGDSKDIPRPESSIEISVDDDEERLAEISLERPVFFFLELWIKSYQEIPPSHRYSAVVIGFGLLGEVGRASERYRWMGPTRYIVNITIIQS
jgi:hypothetical protein